MFRPVRVFNPDTFFQAKGFYFPDDWEVAQPDPPAPVVAIKVAGPKPNKPRPALRFTA